MLRLANQVQSECVERVIDVIARSQKLPREQVTIDSEFTALDIDSVDAIEILFELESEFNIVIPDEKIHSVRTVRQVVDAVEQLVEAKPSGTAAS